MSSLPIRNLMSYRILMTFIFSVFSLLFYTHYKYQPGERKIASVDKNNYLLDDLAFSKAAFNFELMGLVNKEDIRKNIWEFEKIKFRLEQNLYTEDPDLIFMSQAALLRFNFAREADKEFQKNFKALFFEVEHCKTAKSCIFQLNTMLKIAEDFNIPKILKVLDLKVTTSPFSFYLKQNIKPEILDFESDDERKAFSYIYDSAITHLNFEYELNRPLKQYEGKDLFPERIDRPTLSQLENLQIPNFLNEEDEKDEEEVDIIDYVIDTNYSLDYLKYQVSVWDNRNTILQHYLTRFQTKHLSRWFHSSPNQELSLDALKRYFQFEVKLPTRNDFLFIIKNANFDNKSMVDNLTSLVETFENQIYAFFQENIEKGQPESRTISFEDVLKIEKTLYFKNHSNKNFYGFLNQVFVESNLMGKVIEQKQFHFENVKKDKVIYEGHFEFYKTQQDLDESWLSNICQVRQEIRNRLIQRFKSAGKNQKEYSIHIRGLAKLSSPYSGINYDFERNCKRGEKVKKDNLIHKFALKKAINAGADGLIIGKWGSTLISVLGWFGAFRITQALMKKFLSESAKKAAVFNAKNLPRWSKEWFSSGFKYRLFPFLAVDYAMNSIVMATVRSTVASSIDQSTGRSRSFMRSFLRYLENYTIMYLSIPPVAYFMTTGGRLMNPVVNVYSKVKGAVPPKFKLTNSQKVGSFVKGAIEGAKFNVVASVSFLPVFYVYDILYYFSKDQKVEPTFEQAFERLTGAMSWTFVWQVMNNVVSRRFGPPKAQMEKQNPGERTRRNEAEGAEGGGAEGGGAEG